MFTLNLKVLFNNSNYGLLVSAGNWPSTGSTSTMMLALSSVFDLPACRWLFTELITLSIAPAIIVTGFIFRTRSLGSPLCITGIGLSTLFSWATLLASLEILANWCESTIRSSL